MEETTIGQKEQAEPDKGTRTENTIAGKETAMRGTATNDNGKRLLHN